MSQKVDHFDRRKHRRYTKKIVQSGGAEGEGESNKYKVTGKGDFVPGLSEFLADNTTPTGTKTTKASIPRAKSDLLKTKLQKDGYAFKETGSMGCRNCDREITTPLAEKFQGTDYTDLELTVASILSAEVEVEINPKKKQDFEDYASKNKLDVKTSTGISVSVQDTRYTIDSDKEINLPDNVGSTVQKLKTIKVTVLKSKKSDFENAVKAKANEGYSCKNTDSLISRGDRSNYELTAPTDANIGGTLNGDYLQQQSDNTVLRYTTVVRVTNLSEFKKIAKSNDYVVKDSNGNKLKLNNDQEYSVITKGSVIPVKALTDINAIPLNVDSFVMNVGVPKDTTEETVKTEFTANNVNFDVKVKKDGMCGISKCDYGVTLYPKSTSESSSNDVSNPSLPSSGGITYTLNSVRTNFQVSTEEQLRKLKVCISNHNLELKDPSGKTVNVKVDKELVSLQKTYDASARPKYTITFTKKLAELSSDSKYNTTNDDSGLIDRVKTLLKAKDPNANFDESDEPLKLPVITTLNETQITEATKEIKDYDVSVQQEDSTPKTFEELITIGLDSRIEVKAEPYDEAKFEEAYTELVVNNSKMKTDGTLIIQKPTQLKDKMVLYTLLMNIKALVRGTLKGQPDPIVDQREAVKKADPSEKEKAEATLLEMEKASLLTQRIYVATFFISVNELRQTAKGDLTPDSLKDTPVGVFFKQLYDVEKPIGWLGGTLNAATRVVPLIAMFRNYSKGLHTISFDSKMIGEEVLRQQRKDIARGIENEFAMMSAFVGTKSQKVAGKTAIIAGLATGLWGLVAQIQKNPATAGILAGVVAGCGPQAIVAAGIFAIAVAAYYVYLKIQDKYAKYFNLIRTMNEFMIVLNKIERLVRLSMNISQRYQFNVNLKEIEAQLKILFDRFNKMLSEDDVSQIEQSMKNQTKLPDFGEAAANAEATADEIATKAMDAEDVSTNSQGGGGFGDFLFKVTFDVEMWNQKLNDDVVKLNLYFTTAMVEFSMVLNVIQIGLLTSGEPERNVIKQANLAVTKSTEYRKMIIGILLNDILKLRVDYSYCNRGGSLTNTKSEGVCMDPENMEIDSVGNRRSKFKEKLHGLIKYLAEVLTHPNCPYPPEIKYRIKEAVINPYVRMVNDAKLELGKGNKFYLTDTATLNPEDIKTAKEKAITYLGIDEQKLSRQPTSGGKWRETKPSPERDVSIIQELKSRAYDFVTHEAFMQFLMGVDKFVKAENEPSLTEKKEAENIAKEIVADAKILAVVTADLKETQQLAAESAKAEEERLKAKGGRRLTRKRIFKLKKNRRITRIRPPFKSAAVAVAAFRRK